MIETPERRGTDSVKWGLYEEDVLPLWVADMDFASPPEVIEALERRVKHGVFGYGMGSTRLKDLVIARMQERHGWTIQREDICFIPGVVTGLNLVCQAAAQPGESILMQPPIYPPFLAVPGNANVKAIYNEVKPGSGGVYEVDLEDFERGIQTDTRCFMLCNPHNPVGRVYSRDELSAMAEICLRHRMVICSDEIHSDLIYSGHRHTPIASIDKEIENHCVTLLAPSKTFNIPGLECSVLICKNAEIRKQIEAAQRGLMGYVNILGITAAEAAYQLGDRWLSEVLALLEVNRDYLYEYLAENIPQIKMVKPQGTYLAWLDCRSLELPLPPQRFFLERAKVALNEGAEFGAPGRGFVRLNFACSREILTAALERMTAALGSI